MADNLTIARPYAQAVFEIAHAEESLEQWSNALAIAAAVAADEDVISFVEDPRTSEAEQVRFLGDVLASAGESYVFAESNQAGRNFLKLLVENDRVAVLPEIAARFDELKDAVENAVDVTVTAAYEIGDDQLGRIREALSSRLGQHINLNTEIDKDMIGGAVIRAGDMVIDGSVRTRLSKLANALAG